MGYMIHDHHEMNEFVRMGVQNHRTGRSARRLVTLAQNTQKPHNSRFAGDHRIIFRWMIPVRLSQIATWVMFVSIMTLRRVVAC